MTKDPQNALDDIFALVRERQKYEVWLSALAARRETTPAHVFDRVHADYETRLRGVMERLAAHRGTLQEQGESLGSRLAILEAEAQMRRDERLEAELRAHVGELTQSEWEAKARECDQALASLGSDQAALREQLDRVREILQAIMPSGASGQRQGGGGGSPAAPRPAVPPPNVADESWDADDVAVPPASTAGASHDRATHAAAPAASDRRALSSDERTTPVVSPVAPSPEPIQSAAPVPRSSFDEIAFLNSVVGAPRSEPESTGPLRATESDAEGSAIATAQSAEETEPQPESPAATRPSRVSGVYQDESASDSLLAGLRGETPLADNVTGNHPIVLRPSGEIQQNRSLKCVECGAMNYPTEWYCERCGAELASL